MQEIQWVLSRESGIIKMQLKFNYILNSDILALCD